MPQIQPWIDERKWKRRRWWLRGHDHERLPGSRTKSHSFWLGAWLSLNLPEELACCYSFNLTLCPGLWAQGHSIDFFGVLVRWWGMDANAYAQHVAEDIVTWHIQAATLAQVPTSTSINPLNADVHHFCFFSCLWILLKEILQNNYELKCLGWHQKASILARDSMLSTNFWLEIGQWRLQGHECWDSPPRFQTSSATSCIFWLVELQFLLMGFQGTKHWDWMALAGVL